MKPIRSAGYIDHIVTWSMDRPLPAWAHFVIAAVVIVAVGAFRALFVPASLPWLLFVPATIALSLAVSRKAGYVGALLSAVVGLVSIAGPNLRNIQHQQWVSAWLFLLVNLGIVALVATLRDSILRARRLNAELAERERQARDRESFLSSVLSSSTDCIKVLDLDGRLTFMSEGGKRVMEVSDFNTIAQCPWPDFWQGSGNAAAVEAIAAARRGEARSFIGRASTMAGTSKWWHVAVSPICGEDGKPDRILSVSRDVTDLHDSEEERDRFVRLAENSTDFIGMAHLDGSVFYLNDAARRMVGLGDDAIDGTLAIADFFPADQNDIIRNEVLPTAARVGHWEGEMAFRHFVTGDAVPVLYSVFAMKDTDGALIGYGTVTRDFRANKAAQEQLHLLNGELSHRLKNTLGVVQAIAIQTLASADPEAMSAFSKRLNALAAAHDVLLKRHWSDAQLRDIAAGALATFDDLGRVRIEGPDLPMGPRAALALSLLLHELATNATKYGALSVPGGTVTVGWKVTGDGDDATLTMCWEERGGPPATPPTRKGFGSRIIRMGLTGSGGVDLRYGPQGLTAVMSAPLDQLQQA